MKVIFQFLFCVTLISCSQNKTLTESEAPYDSANDENIMLEEISVIPKDTREYRASKNRIHDLIHSKLEVSFNWQERLVLGEASLKLKPYFYPSNKLSLDAKGMIIHGVFLLNGAEKTPLTFNYDSYVLEIDLDRSYSKDEEFNIHISYTAQPEKTEQEGSSAIGMANGLYFINPDSTAVDKPTQIWTQGETESSSCWFPTIDSPNERMTQELAITVPEKFKTLSNGELIFQNYSGSGMRTDYWEQMIPHAPYLVMIAIGDFEVVEDSWSYKGQEMLVDYYLEPEYAEYAVDIFGNTPEMLTFYSEILGYTYPWDKYSQVVVRDFVSGAMENTTAVIHGEFLNATAKDLVDSNNEDVIAHELFHHWFGDLVTCESWANLPLNESFATYGEYLWIEYKYGRQEADLHGDNSMAGYLAESQMKQENLIRFYYDDKEDMFDGHSYNKGGRVLHMLRYFLGDDAFFAGLQLYLKNNEFKSVEIHQFRLAMEEVSGKDLNWFFNQWFLGSGHPQLNIEYEIHPDTLEIKVTQLQDNLFRLPLYVDLISSTGNQKTRIDIRKKEQSFFLPYEGSLKYANVDADKVLLGTKFDNRPDSWWANQYENAHLYLDKKEAIEKCLTVLDTTSLNALYSALSDDFWKIQELALSGVEHLKYNSGLEDVLVDLVNNSPKSSVQAKAISALIDNYDPKNHSDLLEDLLHGKSNLVAASALENYSKVDSVKVLEKCKLFEHETNYFLKSAVASIYSQYGGEDEYEFFDSKLKNSSGYELYSLINSFTNYLTRQSSSTVSVGLKELELIASEGEIWWVRLSALNGLKTFHSIYMESASEDSITKANTISEIANSILKKETNEELLQYAPKF